MYGLTEFEVRKKNGRWRIYLVSGSKTVMRGEQSYVNKHVAYAAAERWISKMAKQLKSERVLRNVRFVTKGE